MYDSLSASHTYGEDIRVYSEQDQWVDPLASLCEMLSTVHGEEILMNSLREAPEYRVFNLFLLFINSEDFEIWCGENEEEPNEREVKGEVKVTQS